MAIPDPPRPLAISDSLASRACSPAGVNSSNLTLAPFFSGTTSTCPHASPDGNMCVSPARGALKTTTTTKKKKKKKKKKNFDHHRRMWPGSTQGDQSYVASTAGVTSALAAAAAVVLVGALLP